MLPMTTRHCANLNRLFANDRWCFQNGQIIVLSEKNWTPISVQQQLNSRHSMNWETMSAKLKSRRRRKKNYIFFFIKRNKFIQRSRSSSWNWIENFSLKFNYLIVRSGDLTSWARPVLHTAEEEKKINNTFWTKKVLCNRF